MKIEEPITLNGFAWLDEEDGSINWATAEDMLGVSPADRPDGATPVIIEIVPTEEWTLRKQRDYNFLGDVAAQINQFSSELDLLQKSLKIKGQ